MQIDLPFAFDPGLSKTVSLHRVLDHLVESGEKPGIVIGFLSEHQDKLDDILEWATCTPRLLSLDFLEKCRISEKKWMLETVWDASCSENLIFKVQMSTFSHMLDLTTRRIIKDVGAAKSNPVHKYRGWVNDRFSRAFDDEIAKNGFSNGSYSQFIDGLSSSDLQRIVEYSNNSPFIDRMFQEDVFLGIQPVKQFVMLNALRIYNIFAPSRIVKGLMQTIRGGGDKAMRRKICDMMSQDNMMLPDKKLSDLCSGLDEYESFNQIAVRLDLGGMDMYCDWVLFYLVCRKGLEFCKSGMKSHRWLFEEYFDITDLLDSTYSTAEDR